MLQRSCLEAVLTTKSPRRAKIALVFLGFLAVFFLLSAGVCRAQNILDMGRADVEKERRLPVMPFVFPFEDGELYYGVIGGARGLGEEQTRVYGLGFGATNSSYGVLLGGAGFRLPGVDRVFFDMNGFAVRADSFEFYDGDNDTDEDNKIETSAEEYSIKVPIRVLLPIGAGRDETVHTFHLDRGLLVEGATGGEVWNPLESGRTFVEIIPFFRKRNVDLTAGQTDFNTNGIELALKYDNTDCYANPSKGSIQRIAIKRDFGAFDSSDSWTAAEAEFSKYFDLGQPLNLRQLVLATNVWTTEVLTWKEENGDVSQGPPFYEGAVLGGRFRMRGFTAYRFYDKAAVYYAAELRAIPEWNPIAYIDRWNLFECDWFQFVLFGEVGRVAETWSLDELHSDMKWDVGVGIRAMLKGTVARIDWGFSEDESAVYFMVGHPF
jgi:hypothetical protein